MDAADASSEVDSYDEDDYDPRLRDPRYLAMKAAMKAAMLAQEDDNGSVNIGPHSAAEPSSPSPH